MILGKTWFKKHNPVIDWTRNLVCFPSRYCQAHCLPTWDLRSKHVTSANSDPAKTGTPGPNSKPYKIAMIFRAAFQYAAKTPDSELYVIAASAIHDNNLDPSKDQAKHPDNPPNVVPEAYHNLCLW